MYRIGKYRDPLEQMLDKEFFSVGCGSCLHNTKTLCGYKCRKNEEGYPDADCHTCKSWQRRAGRDG